jgi:hypothetical protein
MSPTNPRDAVRKGGTCLATGRREGSSEIHQIAKTESLVDTDQ